MPQVVETRFLTCLLHRIFYLLGRYCAGTFYIYTVYLYLVFLIDLHIYNNTAVARCVGTLVHDNLGVLVAFVIEIVLDYLCGTVYNIGSYLITFYNTYLELKLLALRLLYTFKIELRHTRALLEGYSYIYFTALYTIGCNTHIFKKTMLPEALDGICYLIAGYRNHITYREPRQAGAATVRKLVENSLRLGVKYLTLYTFSTENWNRPVAEVAALMALLFESIEEEIFVKNNVAFRIIGDMSKLPDNVRQRLEACIERTSGNDSMTLVLALSYSSKWEITEAVRSIAQKVKEGKMEPCDINDTIISQELATNFMPDPDLLIRTGKEQRLSNFLLWQAAYSEFYFTEVLWPDFDNEELCKAVCEYQRRQRRYGLTGEQVTNDYKTE